MRCGVLLCTVMMLAAASGADAARNDVSVQATPTSGAAPLEVMFTASEPVHWDFGDGQTADGPTAQHLYAAGRWHATWSSPNGSGGVDIVAHGIELAAPPAVRYATRATFRGRLIPAERGVHVEIVGPKTTLRTTSRANGTFAVRVRLYRPAVWSARTPDVRTDAKPVAIVPRLRTSLVGSGARGSRYVFAGSVRPKDAGQLDVTITRNGTTVLNNTIAPPVRIKLDTRRLAAYTIRVHLRPSDELFRPVTHVLHAHVVLPRLRYGMRSSAVAQLAQRLRELHYMAPLTATFDTRLLDAVYAFQKVQSLPRTGTVTAAFWRRLADPSIPMPRYAQPAAHLEINKPRQVLYVVRNSRIASIIPVSTAGLPGKFTPTGRFAIYRKVTGFDPSPLGTLYDPMYFTGGYAIHGNPSVPPYPASHGCVRVPMWIAPYLYATNPYGEAVYVY